MVDLPPLDDEMPALEPLEVRAPLDQVRRVAGVGDLDYPAADEGAEILDRRVLMIRPHRSSVFFLLLWGIDRDGDRNSSLGPHPAVDLLIASVAR